MSESYLDWDYKLNGKYLEKEEDNSEDEED